MCFYEKLVEEVHPVFAYVVIHSVKYVDDVVF